MVGCWIQDDVRRKHLPSKPYLLTVNHFYEVQNNRRTYAVLELEPDLTQT